MTLLDTASKEARPSPEDWGYEFLDFLDRGVDLSSKPRSLADGAVLKAENVRFFRNAAVVTLGYKSFSNVVEGTPRASYQLFLKNGSSFLTLITNTRFYVWNSNSNEWDYVSNGNETTLNDDHSATDTNLTVVDSSGFSVSDIIGVRLNDGSQHRTTISAIPDGTHITLADGLPDDSDSGNALVEATVLTGDDDTQPSVTTWAATDKMYFTNYSDPPKSFNGTVTADVSGLPAGFKAKMVTVHINHLLFFHTEENGTAFPQRERWSDVGSDSTWNVGVNYVDHYDNEAHITAVESLGVYLMIYKERGIIRQEFVGDVLNEWDWVTVIDGEGAVSQDSVLNLGDEHVFWGSANVYRYRGGFDLEAIGDAIFDGVLSASDGDINPDKKQRIFGVYIEEFDEAWFFYPTAGKDWPNRMARLRPINDAWSFRTFPVDIAGFGFFTGRTGVTWNTAVGTWAAATGPWVGTALQAGAPTVLLCDADNDKVYEFDFFASDDDGAAISYELITKDWFESAQEIRFDRYDFRCRGSNILVEASFDGGENYKTLGTVSPGTVIQRQRIYQQNVGRSVRFRFTGSSGFRLEEIGFAFKQESKQP